MARTARKKSNTGIYHVLLRAEGKMFADDFDRQYFLALMKQYFTGSGGGRMLGYSMSEKKVHLVIAEHTSSAAQIIKAFCTSYARYFNRTHNTSGKLFYGRFKSEPVESREDLASLIRYIYREHLEDYEKDGIIEDKIKKSDLNKAQKILCMDDFENMPEEEFSGVMNYLCSDIQEFYKLSPQEKVNVFYALDKGNRVRIGLILKAVGADTATMIKDKIEIPDNAEEKRPENKKPSKKELSVWLL